MIVLYGIFENIAIGSMHVLARRNSIAELAVGNDGQSITEDSKELVGLGASKMQAFSKLQAPLASALRPTANFVARGVLVVNLENCRRV